MRAVRYTLSAAAIGLFVSCGFAPEKVSLSDPRVVPLLQAATNFARASYGFTPIPTNADVRLESRRRAGYDAMLHFYGETSRTVAFRKTPTGWKWIHEQEIFTGPNLYTNVDGVFHEEIVITYGTEATSGNTPNKLKVQYEGEDLRLTSVSNRYDLTLAQVAPVLEQWRQKR